MSILNVSFLRWSRLLLRCLALSLGISACATLGSGKPEPEAVEAPVESRLVGLGYALWFPPQDWNNAWSVPMIGDYRSDNASVLRRHAEWFITAGVDFVWVDWSNNILAHERPELQPIEDATRMLFEVYNSVENAPKVSIFLGFDSDPAHIENGNLQRKADQVWDTFVTNPDYDHLLLRHLGKPLLVIYVGTPSPFKEGLPAWDDSRFTVRWMTGFLDDQPQLRAETGESTFGYWSWWDRAPQSYAVVDGRPENVAVSAAHPGFAGWGQPGTRGREDGNTFREQWARARELDPHFVLINSWNEWVAPEEVDPEFSNDLEPSEAWKGQYLYLLRDEIAAWKAMPARTAAPAPAPEGEEGVEQAPAPPAAPEPATGTESAPEVIEAAPVAPPSEEAVE